MSKKKGLETSTQKPSRNFIESNKISKHLMCMICQDIFDEPNRISCGHTFCAECINELMKHTVLCPICRKKIVKNQISKDLVAFNIINDLEVTCNNDLCPWKGVLSQLERHLFYCLFDKQKLSDEIKIILEKDSSGKITKESENSFTDKYLNFNSQSSLKARLYEKNPEIMINSLKKNEFKEINVMDLIERSTTDKEGEKVNNNLNESGEKKKSHENIIHLSDNDEERNNFVNNGDDTLSSNFSSDKQSGFLMKELKEKTKKNLNKTKKFNKKDQDNLIRPNEIVLLEGEPQDEGEEDKYLQLALKRSLEPKNINN